MLGGFQKQHSPNKNHQVKNAGGKPGNSRVFNATHKRVGDEHSFRSDNETTFVDGRQTVKTRRFGIFY